MNVACTIDYVDLENDDRREVESVRATRSTCGHETESFGTSAVRVRRCLVLMREECPHHQSNWYFAEDGEDEE